MLGRIYMRTGRSSDAIDALKISIWSADTIAARLALAETYLQTRNTAAARAEAQAVLRRDAGNLEARRILYGCPRISVQSRATIAPNLAIRYTG